MSRTFMFPRPRPRGLLGRRLEGDEQLVLGSGLVLALSLVWLVPTVVGKIVECVVVAGVPVWAVLAPWKGRTFFKWFEIRRTYRRLLRDGSLLYKSKAAYAGRYLSGHRAPVELPVGVPQDLEWITSRTAYGDIAIVLAPNEQWFTAAMEVEGEQNFGGLDVDDKAALIRAYEFLLKTVADSGRIERLQWISRVVPTDPNAHARDAAARRDPAAPTWLHDSYDELQRAVAISAEDRRLILTVGIPYSTELVAEARRYDTLAEGYAVTLGKEIEGFIRQLGRAQLRHIANLDEAGLASFIHHAYDPTHWIDDTSGMDQVTAWPAEIDARDPVHMASRTWDNADPWYSATGWWQELPALPVGLNFLAPLLLYVQDVIYTVSVTMHLVSSDEALAEAMADATNELGQADDRPGRVVDPRETRAQRQATTTMHEIASGAAGVRLAGWVTVTAPSEEALARQRDEVRAAATRSQIKVQWCEREHYRAFANTLPFAGGLLEE